MAQTKCLKNENNKKQNNNKNKNVSYRSKTICNLHIDLVNFFFHRKCTQIFGFRRNYFAEILNN